jgi:hypothetical protein
MKKLFQGQYLYLILIILLFKSNCLAQFSVTRSNQYLGNDEGRIVCLNDFDNDNDIIYANFIIENNQIKSYPNTIWLNRKFNPNWQQPIPGDTPEIFLPEIVSVKGKNTHACTFSPDGKQLYFSRYPDRKSFVMTFENGQWSNPQEAFFNGKETSISSSNEILFYYRDGDIYFNKKTEEGWGNAINVGKDINTAEMEYYPSVTDDGTLFFSRNGNWDEGRIMYSTFKNGKYAPPVDIGFPVNNGGASHAYVAPDKSYMIFNSPRKGSYTKLDLWISFRNEIDIWTNPQNLGKTINSGGDAILCPTVSPDGKYLFFTRLQKDGTGYIYWVSAKIINRIRKQIMR